MRSINPYTEELMAEFDVITWEEAEEKIRKARKRFDTWKNVPIWERTGLLKDLASVLRKNKQKYAETITKEIKFTIQGEIK